MKQERALHDRVAQAMVEVARAITASRDLQTVLERIVDQACLLLDADRLALAVLEPGGSEPNIRFVAVRGLSPEFIRLRPLNRRDGTTPAAIFERRPVWTADLVNDPAFVLTPSTRAFVEAEGYRAVLSVPLLVGERTLGAVVLYRDRPGPFSEEEVDLLQVFAAHASVALENAELFHRSETRAAKLSALSTLTQRITSARSSAEVFDAVAEAAGRLLEARVARVWIDDPSAGGLRAVAGFSIDPVVLERLGAIAVVPYGGGLIARIFGGRTPEYVRDIQQDDRWTQQALARELDLRAYAGIPMLGGDRVLGVLSLVFADQRDFPSEDRELLALLAGQASIAITQAEAYAEAERRRREAEVMAELARDISASLDLDTVLERVVRGAKDLCGADSARIGLRAPGDTFVTYRHALGVRHPGLRDLRVEAGKGSGGLVLLTGRPLRTDDYLADPNISKEYADVARFEGTIAEMVVPIRGQDGVEGLLYVTNRSPRRFTDHDEATLTRLADHASTAIRNAALYQQLHRAHEERARSQAQLVKSERLRALGEMAAGVAHDFNNLLAVILGRSELLLRRLSDQPLVSWAEAIRQAARDGADTVRRIQEFTRTRTSRSFDRVDMGAVIREVVELTRPRWEDEAQSRGAHYDVVVATAGEALVAGRPEELREVFTNLLSNALDAMPEGGRCALVLTVRDAMAEVEVVDTGCGIPDDVRQRVFEPFFTTKGHRGNGLGLAVAWGIVTRHGGTIEVASTRGEGSRFTVRLPLGGDVPASEPLAAPPAAQRPGRILVVDDDPEVRAVLTILLSEGGHAVTEAGSGPDALARCERESFDLLLSDLSMPRMSGWDVAAACHERFPHLPVALVTGWGDQLDPRQLERHHVRFVVAKPFEAAHILKQVADALPAAPARG